MENLYAVPWVEIEYGWGERPEGFKIFTDLNDCINQTNIDSENGNYESGKGYMGPVRPLQYYIIPFDKEIKDKSFVNNIDPISNVIYHTNKNNFR